MLAGCLNQEALFGVKVDDVSDNGLREMVRERVLRRRQHFDGRIETMGKTFLPPAGGRHQQSETRI